MKEIRGHLLVVDDEPSVLVTYRMILEQQDYKVSAALSSEEARNALSKEEIDLLLCDLSLERQESGFDVIAFGLAKRPTLVCVLLTGYATPEAVDWAEAKKIPMLFKPIEIRELLETIQTLLRNRDEIRQTANR